MLKNRKAVSFCERDGRMFTSETSVEIARGIALGLPAISNKSRAREVIIF